MSVTVKGDVFKCLETQRYSVYYHDDKEKHRILTIQMPEPSKIWHF